MDLPRLPWMPKLPRLNVAAIAAVTLAVLSLVSAAGRLNGAWVAACAGGALIAGHLGRRPALRRRRPRVEDVRSLVVATAGMTLGVIAALVAALPYVPKLVHP